MRLEARCTWFLAAAMGTCGPLAADVLRVGPGQPFAEIAPAVAAAADGDLILVEPGLYADLDVVDKSISVVGAGGGTVTVRTTSGATVSSLAAGKCVVLANLVIEVPPGVNPTPSALRISDCMGSVRVDNSYLYGSDNSLSAASAVTVSGSTDVAITRSALYGGYGRTDATGDGSPGGHGLAVGNASRAAVYDSILVGGDGGDRGNCIFCIGGDGGHGAHVSGTSELFASGATLTGGTEGNPGEYVAGRAGRGLDVSNGSSAVLLDCQRSSTTGPVQYLPGSAHRLSAVTPAAAKTAHRFSIRGGPGDEVFLLESDRPGFLPLSTEPFGVLAIGADLATAARPVGVLAGTVMVFHRALPALPAGEANARHYVQVLVRNAGGGLTLSGPLSLDLIE